MHLFYGKAGEAAQEAANAMNITAKQLFDLKKVIDGVIDEPLGGAHRNLEKMAENLKVIVQELKALSEMDKNALVSHRKNKFASIGRFTSNN